MSVEKTFSELLNQDLQNMNIEAIKILATLDKNIAMKTEIEYPELLSFYKTCAIYLKQRGLKNSSDTVNNLIKYYLLYMVSKKRKGRGEIIEALRAIKETMNNNLNKVLGKNSQ